MNLLLDTHAFLWYAMDSAQLGPQTRQMIASPANEVFLSAAIGGISREHPEQVETHFPAHSF